jgi:4-diphosphocytidyl-2-C-methyl-D-erythritol kinase
MRAHAKLTLSLRITGRRDDGYHTIEADLITIDFADILIFEKGTGLQIVDEVPGGLGLRDISPGRSNLVNKAMAIVGETAAVRMLKRIPSGAGLGGGSADAAAVLRWAGYSSYKMAVRLGADVPFCLIGGMAHVGGIGEQINQLPFEESTFVLMLPPFGLETGRVYEQWDRLPESLQHISSAGSRKEETAFVNDLEPAALRLEPQLELWKEAFGNATGLEPHMAGSGSAWFIKGSRAELGLEGRTELIIKDMRAPILEVNSVPAISTIST